ncbi:hypothetical protein A2U01_0043841 [Trifolium medium]|uniref:Uncharacterized protein n=1 Tax=Trifolium medium TaxID=97028 RepID=A0A392QH94_9FABA|nr:hypothetical protein [Trifolium medium]
MVWDILISIRVRVKTFWDSVISIKTVSDSVRVKTVCLIEFAREVWIAIGVCFKVTIWVCISIKAAIEVCIKVTIWVCISIKVAAIEVCIKVTIWVCISIKVTIYRGWQQSCDRDLDQRYRGLFDLSSDIGLDQRYSGLDRSYHMGLDGRRNVTLEWMKRRNATLDGRKNGRTKS